MYVLLYIYVSVKEKRGFLSNILKKSKTPADEASMQVSLC